MRMSGEKIFFAGSVVSVINLVARYHERYFAWNLLWRRPVESIAEKELVEDVGYSDPENV